MESGAKKGLIGGCVGAALLGCAVAAGAAVVAVAVVVAASLMGGGSVDEVAERLPDDVVFVGVGRGYLDLASELSGTFDSGQPNPVLDKLRDEARQSIGLDPLDPESWAETGADFTRPWAFASRGAVDMREADLIFLVPTRDEAAADRWVKALLDKQKARYSTETIGEHEVVIVEDAVAYTFHDDYLVGVGSQRRQFDPRTALRVTLQPPRTLDDNESFQAVVDALDDDWHSFGYVSPAVLDEARAELRRKLGSLGEQLAFRSIGYAAHYDDERLRGQAAILLESSDYLAELSRLEGSDNLGGHIGGEGLAGLRGTINLESSWDRLLAVSELGDELGRETRQLRDSWGIDVETDIIHNLDGHFGAVVLPGANSPSGDVSLVAWAGLQDEAKATAMLDAITGKLRDRGKGISTDREDGASWYHLDDSAVGVSDGHLVVAIGDGRMAQVRKQLKDGSGSFLDELPSALRSGMQGGDPFFGFVDLARIVDVYGEVTDRSALRGWFSPNDVRELKAVVGIVSQLSASLRFREDAVLSTVEVRAAGGSFAEAARAWVDTELAEQQLAAMRAEVPGNVDGIRTAELAFDAAFDHFVQAGSQREAEAALNGATPHAWPRGTEFDTLGWAPDGEIRGAYWVETTRWDFTVHGICDLDGDGVYAHYTASPRSNARMITAADVY